MGFVPAKRRQKGFQAGEGHQESVRINKRLAPYPFRPWHRTPDVQTHPLIGDKVPCSPTLSKWEDWIAAP